MPDDDCIQYLGTRPASRPLPSHPFLSSSQRPVTGVELHIEKSTTEPGHSLIFRKADEPVVHIGRRPGSDSDKGKKEPGKAFFACPVVSRHHAKIAFSDSGHAYLIDLNSHHGTHVRRDEAVSAVSKQLVPETPTLLADGDVVTFGKSVGSDKGLVRPIVARIDLLYGSQPPLKPLVVPGLAEGSILRPPSGRYGVYVPEVSSPSDDSSSPGSHDSDIEEIPGPLQARPPWHDNGSDSTSPLQGSQKKCLAAPRPFSPFAMLQAWSPMRSSSPFDCDSFRNVGFDAYSRDIFEDDDNSNSDNYSRSTSPMDLSSSPEPSDLPAKNDNPIAVGEPVIIGAWPRSRSSSPSIFSSSFPPVRIAASVEEPVVTTPVAKELEVVDLEPNASLNEVEAEDNDDNDDTDEGDKSGELSETAELKASLATVKSEVAKLHAHRRKYKQRFNDNLHVMGDKFSDLEERTSEAHDLYQLLSDRLEESVDACNQAQAQLDVLQDRMDITSEKASEVETPPYANEAKASAKALEQLVVGMSSANLVDPRY
ncbi:hypothetical protein B0H17DRAFT_1056449 [Mycena rosella]|uniref:FHA domain-containing protein n=1 Tax=Mycena rosella TaxID=1033263 RepID=A0AAD7DP03_MYCRO|nr:hypothetical protein B0H17DRAFT_1056449 [Mycena rosella]